jgi:hypothetical protein
MKNNQKQSLFNNSSSFINTSSNNSNIVHNRAVTSTISNDNKNTLNSQNFKTDDVMSRINAMRNESFEDFNEKHAHMIYAEQDRRLELKRIATT